MNAKYFAATFLLFALSGCAEFIAESNRIQAERDREQRAEINRLLDQKCSGYGFRPGTDAFASCKQQELNNAMRSVERQQAIRQLTTCKNEWGREVPCSSIERQPRNTNTQCYSTGNGNYSCSSTTR